MLARFTIENYLSFKEKQSFTMYAGRETINNELYSKYSNSKILNYTSIHGSNASGKSNLIKAIDAGKRLLTRGPERSKLQTKYFKIGNMKNEKSYFDYEILLNGKIYAYGFEIVLSEDRIVSEWLFQLTSKGNKTIFTRDLLNKKIESGVKMKTDISKKFDNWLDDSLYTDNELFLKTIVAKNRADLDDLEIFYNVYNWFRDQLIIVYPDTKLTNIEYITENKHSLSDMIRELDTGIQRICKVEIAPEYLPAPLNDEQFQLVLMGSLKNSLDKHPTIDQKSMTMSDGVNLFKITYLKEKDALTYEKLIFWHAEEKLSEPLELHEESDGTQRMIDILMYMVNAQIKGQTLLIDEIERSMHPNVVKEIIRYYLQTNKEMSTQLIYSTHDENFIDLSFARKDTIWFVSKNVLGYTELSCLEEFKIRSDRRNLKSDYLEGRFGGTPSIGSLIRLTEEEVTNA